jgi:hypothetical protein
VRGSRVKNRVVILLVSLRFRRDVRRTIVENEHEHETALGSR